MTLQLDIPTPFADLAEFTDNFAQRADQDRLMLPNAEPLPEGEWVQFVVSLADGAIALEGVGKVQDAFDNGEEHPPEYRFDIVVTSLQLEGMHEVMFERLLVARQSQTGGEPVTGEVSLDDLEGRGAQPGEDGAEPTRAFVDPAQIAATRQPETTGEVDVGELREEKPARRQEKAAPAAPAGPPREPGKLPNPHVFGERALTRPTLPDVWSPTPLERPPAAQSTGIFDYEGGVPRPAAPPRPELDPSQRVQPAPRPGAPWPRRGTGQHAAPAEGYEEVEEAT